MERVLKDIRNHRLATFKPSDYRDILARAVDPVVYSTDTELFSRLCNSILIDEGLKSFALDRDSGAKCYTMSASGLSIEHGEDRRRWRWVSLPGSRFAEVANLSEVWWLQISGTIACRDLSKGATYSAYLIFKLTNEACGFKRNPQTVSVCIGDNVISEKEIYLQPGIRSGHWIPTARSDGWMEIKLGEFVSGGDDGNNDLEATMTFKQVNTNVTKKGLIVEGIQVRPT